MDDIDDEERRELNYGKLENNLFDQQCLRQWNSEPAWDRAPKNEIPEHKTSISKQQHKNPCTNMKMILVRILMTILQY